MLIKSKELLIFLLIITVISNLSCGEKNKRSDSGGTTISGSWSTQLLGTSSDDSGAGVAVDSSGNVYVTGQTEGNLQGNSNSGDDDIFLTKYNSSGSIQWTKLLGTSSSDKGVNIAVASSSDVYIAGNTSGNLGGNINAGSCDIFLTKYNSSGTNQWVKLLGTPQCDTVRDLALDSSGNIYMVGETEGDLGTGNTNAGIRDAWIAKYTSSGTNSWTKLLGSSSSDTADSIDIDSSNNIYVSGSTYGNLGGNTNNGNYDIFLAKYNTSGDNQWTKLLGTSSWDSGSGVAIDSSGNIYLTGSSAGDLGGNSNSGNYDIILAKYNSSGTNQWTRLLGSSNHEEGKSIEIDSSNNLYISGYTLGDLDGNTNVGNRDIFLAKYNSSGNKAWTKTLGTSSNDSPDLNGSAIDSSNNIYIIGESEGNFDGKTNSGGSDAFIVKYNSSGTKQ